MKKSEALEAIRTELKEIALDESARSSYGDLQCKQVLKAIEKAGMIPPYPTGPYNPEELVNDWEPENET